MEGVQPKYGVFRIVLTEGTMGSSRFCMDELPLAAKILKSLIAPARHSDGPTLYLICQVDEQNYCAIYEQMPDGKCLVWPESPSGGVQQAEGMIYRRLKG